MSEMFNDRTDNQSQMGQNIKTLIYLNKLKDEYLNTITVQFLN
jgi:hypothetical protein